MLLCFLALFVALMLIKRVKAREVTMLELVLIVAQYSASGILAGRSGCMPAFRYYFDVHACRSLL